MATVDISYRRIARITSPVVVTQLSYTAMGVIDTIMVGRLGVQALAAIGLANLVTWWTMSFFWGLFSGVNTLVAQAVGAGDRRAVGVVFWQGTYFILFSTVSIIALWPLVPTFFRLAGGSAEIQAIATEYMRIRLLGGLGFSLLLVADNFYRGLGRTDVPMWGGLAQMVLNCGLNYVLIFGKFGVPALGTAGAAWGTTFAQLIVAAALFLTIVGVKGISSEFHIRETWRIDRRVMPALVKLSLPIGVQMFLEMGGITVFSAMVARIGEAELAATNAVIQSWSVAFMGAFALSVGATTLVGQCIGAGMPEEARRVVGRILKVGFAGMSVLAVVYIGIPETLMRVFVDASEADRLLPFARPLFTVVVFCLLFDVAFNIYSGALRGAGDTTYSMLVNIGSAWLVFVPLVIYLTPRYGLRGAWACLFVHVALMAGLMHLRFRGSRWIKSPAAHQAGALRVVPPLVREERTNSRVITG